MYVLYVFCILYLASREGVLLEREMEREMDW